MPRDLVGGDLPFAPGGQLIAGDLRALARHDPGHDLFAVLLGRHADDLDVGDVGMAVNDLLDLARVNVLAAANDHVLDPPDDVQVSLLIHRSEVAGVHPAGPVDRQPRRVLVIPVPAHHDVPAAA